MSGAGRHRTDANRHGITQLTRGRGDNGPVSTVTDRDRPASRWAFLAKPWWLVVIGVGLAFAAACWTILAPWQFSRDAETSARNAAISAALAAEPVPAAEYLPVGTPPAAEHSWRVVTATGSYLAGQEVYIRLRQDAAGNPMAEVLLPFRMTDGTIIWVDRGYVPDSQISSGQPAAAPPTGQVTVSGRVQQDQLDPLNRPEQHKYGMRWLTSGFDTGQLSAQAGLTQVRGGFIQLMPDSPGVLIPMAVPQLDSGPYFSYALQWCAFGAVALIAVCYFVYREATDPREEDEDSPERPTELEPAGRQRARFDKSTLYDTE